MSNTINGGIILANILYGTFILRQSISSMMGGELNVSCKDKAHTCMPSLLEGEGASGENNDEAKQDRR